MNGKNNLKGKKGITLIALVVTIVVLIILAGISIGILGGEDGLIEQAKKAKEETEISEEKELLGRVTVQVAGKDVYGNIEEAALQKELDKEAGEGKIEVTDTGEEFEVIFKENNRYYIVDKEGNVGEVQEIIEDKNPGDITKDKDGNELDGSEEKPYEIWCIEDLVEWSENYTKYTNNYINLMRTLNFKSSLSYVNGKKMGCNSIKELKEMLTNTSSSGFKPIYSFGGTFNGNNEWIKNIYVHRAESSVGFFKEIASSTKILNLFIDGTMINDLNYVGAIAGTISYVGQDGMIDNCHNFCNIKGKSYAGGIIGYIHENNKIIRISNCSNSGNIDSEIFTGGIVANTDSEMLIIENCYNKGNVRGSGITANNKSTIKNCYNLGEVDYGLVNDNQNIIENSYSIGMCNKKYVVKNNNYTNSYLYKCFYCNNSAIGLAKNNKINGIDETCKSMEKQEMKENKFVEELNENKTEKLELWYNDTKNVNNGFPIFKWQNY